MCIRDRLILCAEAGPCVGAINLLGRDIVHRNRDAQHAGQCNEVSTHMAVNGHAMVGTPVCHNAVHIGERTLSGQARAEPCGRPGWVGAFVDSVVNLVGQISRPALGRCV